MPAGSSITRVASATDEAVISVTESNSAVKDGGSAHVRIIVFNDHPVFKSALPWKIGEESGIEFIADTVSLSETLQVADEQRTVGAIDAVVADLRIGDGNSEGIESVRTLSTRLASIPIIVYSDYYSRSYSTRMIDAGAAAVVQKSASIEELVDTIHRAVGVSEAIQQPPSEANGSAA